MAASAYKGLTIRIGADTTKLTSALRGIDSAAYKTQRELTKLGKAAQMDPKNSKLASAQLGAMMTQANNAAARLVKLNAAKKEALSQPATSKANAGKTIEDLAKETDNAALAAAEATSRYNELNASIEPAYREVKKLTDIDLREATNAGEFEEMFQRVKDSGKVSDETIHKIESMKDAWMEARANMEDYGKVAALHDITVDAQLAASQIRQMAKSMAELNTKSQFSKNFKDSVSQMGLLSAAADAVNHRISRLDESMRLDPTNMDVARERTKSLADALSIAERQSEILNKELNAYQSEGFEADASKLREEYGSLAEALQKTKSAYEASAPAVAGFKAELDDAQATLQHMKDIDDGSEESKRGIEEQTAAVAKLQEQYDKAATSHQKNTDAYDTAKACTEMENLKVRVMESNDQITKLRNSFGGIEIRSGVSLQVSSLSSQMKVISAGAETAKTRFESLNNSMQLRPYSLGTAIDRVRAFREALDATRQRAQNLREQLDQYKSEGIDKIANSTKDAAVSFEQAQDKVNELNKQLAIAEKQFGEDSAEANKLGEALRQAMLDANTAAAVNEYKDLQTQLRATEAEARSLKNSMKASFGEVGAAAVQAASQIGQLASQAGREVIDSSREIDSAYRDLRKTFDASESEYQALYDAAMEYSKTNVTSADTMLEMESIAAQLGIGLDEAGNKTANATEQIRKFAEVGANLDVATNIDADTIALQMGQIQNVMSDLTPDNIDSFGDALVRLGNTMPTQESNIMQITQRLSSIGDVAGFTTPQLMGWAAAIASTGQKSEAAASGISTTITNIAKAVSGGNKGLDEYAKKAGVSVETLSKAISDNSKDLKTYASAAGVSTQQLKEVAEGAGKLEKFAEVAHMSADKFSKAWKEKPSEALEAFISGLKDTDDELFATLMDLDINGVRQSQTLASLANTVDTVGSAIDRAEDAWNGGGDAAAEAEKKAAGFSGAMQRMENDVQILAASFGEALVPVIEWLGKKLQWLIGVVDSWSDDTKSKVAIAAGAFAAFATAEPIIAALGKNLVGLATGGISLVVNGFASLMVGTKATASILGSFVKAPTETAGALTKLGGSVGLFGKALGLIATPAGVAATAIGGIALAVGAVAFAKWQKAKQSAEEYQEALEGISGVTEDLGTRMWVGSDAVDRYAEKWSAARVNMEEYHKELKGHVETQEEALSSMEATVGELEHYQDIIDGAVGKGKDFHGNLGELQWAIDKLNEKTGASWTLQEILTGKYEDEDGAIRNTKEALDQLIASKEREARISGVETALSENYAAQQKNEVARRTAASAYQDWIDLKLDVKNENGLFPEMSNSEYIKYLQETDEHTQELLMDNRKLREEGRLLKEQEDELSNTLGGLVEVTSHATTMNYGERESIMQTSDTMKEALQSFLGFTDGTIDAGIKGIAQSLKDAGVSTEQFADIGAKKFAELAEESGGDIQKFVELLAEASGQGPIDVDVQANIDEAQAMIDQFKSDTDSTEAEIDVGADASSAADSVEKTKDEVDNTTATIKTEVDNSGTEEAGAKVDDFVEKTNSTEATVAVKADTSDAEKAVDDFVEKTNSTEATVTVKADASQTEGTETTNTVTTSVNVKGADQISKLGKQINSLPKSTPVKVTVSTEKKKVTDVNAALKAVAKTWNAKLNVTVSGTGAVNAILQTLRDADGRRYNTYYDIHQTTHKKTVGDNARGGYVPGMTSIPKHADGFIATRATLTQYGWIGEDGAEAYSGGSLVPLTNRKYSQPYIDDISDAVARKIGPTNAAPQVTVTVTGVSSPDEVADAIARKLTLLGL